MEWRPGIVEPTGTGWIALAVYILTSAACLLAAKRSQFAGLNWRAEITFWLLVALLFLGLGISKHLGLELLIADVFRAEAQRAGWYSERRQLQWIAILAIGGLSLLAASSLLFLTPKNNAQQAAIIGTCYIVGFHAIQSASLHGVDQFLAGIVLGVRWSSIFQILGLVTVGGSALYYASINGIRKFQS